MSIETTLMREKILYAESLNTARQSWPTAFKTCRKDLDYRSRYYPKYLAQQEPFGRVSAIVVQLLIALIVALLVYLFSGKNVILAIIFGVVVFVLLVIAYSVYNRRIELNLLMANERIGDYCARWPTIIDLVTITPDGIIPPEPQDDAAPSKAADFRRAEQVVDQGFEARLRQAAEAIAKESPSPRPKVSEEYHLCPELIGGIGTVATVPAEPETVTVQEKPVAEIVAETQAATTPEKKPRSKAKSKSKSKPGPKPEDGFDQILASALMELDAAEKELDEMDQKILNLENDS